MENETKKIQYELVQNDILKALNNVYIIQDEINNIIETLENITHQKPQDMINDIRDGEVNNTYNRMEEINKDLNQAMEIIKSVINEVGE